jgi:hypothetical protein
MGGQESVPPVDKLPKIIGLCGDIGSGKDSVASYLCHYFGYGMLGFSDPVYESLWRLNPAIVVGHHRAVYLQTLVESLGWDAAKRRYPAIRAMLRTMGHENGRLVFGNYCWINIAKERIKASKSPRHAFRDLRYPEEAEWVYSLGGEVWKIDGRVSEEVASLPKHPSEGNSFPISRVIMNDSSIPVLQRRVNEIMKGFLE